MIAVPQYVGNTTRNYENVPERELRNGAAKTRTCPSLWFRIYVKSRRIAGISAHFGPKFERDGTEWLRDMDSNLDWRSQSPLFVL
jgi:hypothetical protein